MEKEKGSWEKTSVQLTELIKGKRVLFITTKNIDYIRNSQEVRILEQRAEFVTKIFSNRKKYFSRIIEIWMRLFKIRVADFDIVFVGFAPQLVFPFYKKFSRKVIIIDFFVSVYDTLVNDRKKIRNKGIAAKLCHWLDEYVIRMSDHIITDTKADLKYFVEEFYGNAAKFETLYLEADTAIYYERKQNKPGYLKDRFVVLYFGSILPLQGVDVVLKSVISLRDRSDIFFQIIGPVPETYEKPVQENVEYIDWLSQESLAEYIANADLCLAGHFSTGIEKARRTIPGKAYIYEAMGKRMVLGDNEANRELFHADEKHFFVEMGKPEEIVLIIKWLVERVIR